MKHILCNKILYFTFFFFWVNERILLMNVKIKEQSQGKQQINIDD